MFDRIGFWWGYHVTKKLRDAPDPVLKLRPKVIGTMRVCTEASSERSGTITVGVVPGGVVVDTDNGHGAGHRMTIDDADVLAIAAALRNGDSIHRKSALNAGWSFVVKRRADQEAKPMRLDGEPESVWKTKVMMAEMQSEQKRKAMLAGEPHSYTPECCRAASDAWAHERPFWSSELFAKSTFAARLHDANDSPAELAALLEQAVR